MKARRRLDRADPDADSVEGTAPAIGPAATRPDASPCGPPPPPDILRRFLGRVPILGITPLGAGLINATYLVESARGKMVLQRINATVFPAPERISANLSRLQALATAHPELGVRLPELILARDGHPFAVDAEQGVWRMMEFVSPSRTLRSVNNHAQAKEIGRTLGRFHRLSAKCNPHDLAVTLPGFHHTPSYLAAFDRALEKTLGTSRPLGAGAAETTTRAGPCADDGMGDLLSFIDVRRHLTSVLDDAVRDGRAEIRVVHGDPKIDNLLFDRDSDRALCLIDLDTVQPGLIHHDLGDCLRSCCNRAGESAAGTAVSDFDLDLCDRILDGYAEQMRHLLRAAEVALLYPAIRLIPFELGIRFLTDHLQGDRYFKVLAHGENLHKARRQFALVVAIERHATAIEASVMRHFGSGRSR